MDLAVSGRKGGLRWHIALCCSMRGGLAKAQSEISELELELIQTQMAQKPMLRAEVGMRVRCANKASAE